MAPQPTAGGPCSWALGDRGLPRPSSGDPASLRLVWGPLQNSEERVLEEAAFANNPSKKTFFSAIKCLYLFWSFLQKQHFIPSPFTDLKTEPPPWEEGRSGRGHAVRTAQPGLPGRSAVPSEPGVPGSRAEAGQPPSGAFPGRRCRHCSGNG